MSDTDSSSSNKSIKQENKSEITSEKQKEVKSEWVLLGN